MRDVGVLDRETQELTLQVTGDCWLQEHPLPRHVHVASYFPTASPRSSAGVASFSLLATNRGREGTIRLEVLMGNFWCLSCHLGDTWTPVLSPQDESCTHCARSGRPQPGQEAAKALEAWLVGVSIFPRQPSHPGPGVHQA